MGGMNHQLYADVPEQHVSRDSSLGQKSTQSLNFSAPDLSADLVVSASVNACMRCIAHERQNYGFKLRGSPPAHFQIIVISPPHDHILRTEPPTCTNLVYQTCRRNRYGRMSTSGRSCTCKSYYRHRRRYHRRPRNSFLASDRRQWRRRKQNIWWDAWSASNSYWFV